MAISAIFLLLYFILSQFYIPLISLVLSGIAGFIYSVALNGSGEAEEATTAKEEKASRAALETLHAFTDHPETGDAVRQVVTRYYPKIAMKASAMEETPPRPTVECLKRLYSLYEGYIQSVIKTRKIFLEDKDIASQAISASLVRASRSYFYYDNYLPPDSKEKKSFKSLFARLLSHELGRHDSSHQE